MAKAKRNIDVNSSIKRKNLIMEYAGGTVDMSAVLATVKNIVGKNVRELNIYFQPETGMIYYTADGTEGSTRFDFDNPINYTDDQYEDIEYDNLINKLNIPEDIVCKKNDSAKRVHLLYKNKGFAYIDYNKRKYHIFTRQSILDIIGVNYTVDNNHGLNNGGIRNIDFDDISILSCIIEVVKSGFSYDEKNSFKTKSDQKDLLRKLTKDQLYAIAKTRSSVKPKSRTSLVKSSERDVFIRDYSLARANGICQLCGSRAPFNKKNGEPYLESHHIVWISEGGEDTIENTVALCPNCHRKMHVLGLEEDVRYLMKVNNIS